MRSALPKVLHPVCGRPMLHWVIAAARDAGAGRIVCVTRPGDGVAEALPDGVESVEQSGGEGTGAAVAAARERLGGAGTVLAAVGGPPADLGGADRRARRRPPPCRLGRDDAHHRRARPRRLRPRGPRRPTAASSAIVEAKATEGDAHASSSWPSARSTSAHLRLQLGGALLDALAPRRRRQRPGRVLPPRRCCPIIRASRRAPHRRRSDHRRLHRHASASTTASTLMPAWPPIARERHQLARHMLAGVTLRGLRTTVVRSRSYVDIGARHRVLAPGGDAARGRHPHRLERCVHRPARHGAGRRASATGSPSVHSHLVEGCELHDGVVGRARSPSCGRATSSCAPGAKVGARSSRSRTPT